jgi:hypothetical protein
LEEEIKVPVIIPAQPNSPIFNLLMAIGEIMDDLTKVASGRGNQILRDFVSKLNNLQFAIELVNNVSIGKWLDDAKQEDVHKMNLMN